MLVYRISCEDEVYDILNNKSLENIGSHFIIDKNINSHKYKNNKKYIHFFEEYGDIFYYDSEKRCYICTYDIPIDILDESRGIGYYLDRIFLSKIQKVGEFAVESDKIDFSNLLKIEKITDIILYEEFLNNIYQDRIEEVYNCEKKNVLLKKM